MSKNKLNLMSKKTVIRNIILILTIYLLGFCIGKIFPGLKCAPNPCSLTDGMSIHSCGHSCKEVFGLEGKYIIGFGLIGFLFIKIALALNKKIKRKT